MADAERWWANGLLFENCNCQLICPGHLGFKQLCTHARCLGLWAIHVDEGRYGDVDLGGLNAIVLTDGPQRMIDGGWTQATYLDARAAPAQRTALERILAGQAGGGFAVLAPFVTTRLPTRLAGIGYEDAGRRKRMWIEERVETVVEAIKGTDREREVVLENVINQIHGSPQVLALGTSASRDPDLPFTFAGTHALYDRFAWRGP